MTPSPYVAVIGSGIVGAAIAQRLAEKGAAALLLDGSDPGRARNATAASFAAVSAREQMPRAFFDLSRAAMEDYRRLAWKLAPAPWYHMDGSLAWFRDPARAVALQEQVERLRAWGYAAEMLPAREVLADLEPGLALPDPETPVAWFPEEAWVDAVVLTHRLIEAVRNAGGRVLTGPQRQVVAIATEDGRVSTVTLAGGQTIPVASVVNAAGAEGERIAALVGRRLPLTAPRGLTVRAEMREGSDPLRRPVRTDGIAIRPDGPGRILIVPQGEPEDMPSGAIPRDDPRVAEVMTMAAAAVPALATARPISALVAAWPLMADGLPSVGTVPDIPGYVEAVTDYGVTLASLIARSLTDEILGQPGNPLLEPFRPRDRDAA
ncbi:MAG: FAD-binding oxidoreductase [Chloroflexia bacterium]|nr:FAD-binding oxidoreductase [Chloroflexia bacterium]